MRDEFADEFKSRILSRGWSVAEAAHQLGVSDKTITRWKSGTKPTHAEQIRALQRVLGFTQMEIERYLLANEQKRNQPHSRSFADLLQGGMLIADLSDQLHVIEEDEFPVPVSDEDEYGNVENWNGVYRGCQQTGGVVFDKDGKIGAHWLFVPVKPETLKRGLNGENINRTFSMLDVQPFILPGEYDVYFVSLFIREHFNNMSGNKYVLFSIQDKLLELAEEGFFVRRMFGNMSSIAMVSVSESLGFSPVREHCEHRMVGVGGVEVPTQVHHVDLADPSSDRVLMHTPRLLEHYRQWRAAGS